ncbi:MULTISPECIES: PepSY domain-containing protein [unclassified Iodidimonas]|jgi:hypothetical protein|uniref:PepSY domain-containing protein n=1 Tax=unclassified Iodidimonas TaxID=2626145 RepID=UPI0024825BB1|nr:MULTISPECIES: PepSY domain-containing protein [unclassified Iodidimonas]
MKAFSFKWHHRITWIAGVAAILWGLSGLSHPIMVWISPKPAAFAPPVWPLDLAGALSPAQIMEKAGVENAFELRAVALRDQSYYLLRETADKPRRLFDPRSGAEDNRADRARAIALARHYSGDQQSPVKSSVYLADFTADYTENNRLLPVWKIAFDRSDDLVVYVDSGSGNLATIDHKHRRRFSAFFTNVHLLAFLPSGAEWVRLVLIGALVGSLFFASALGVSLIFFIRRKAGSSRARSMHHLLAYGAAIPALMFSASGFYHLIQSSSLLDAQEPSVPPAMLSRAEMAGIDPRHLITIPPEHDGGGQQVVGAMAVRAEDGTILWRLALSPAGMSGKGEAAEMHEHAHHDHSAATSAPPTRSALWVRGDDGQPILDAGEAIARVLASRAVGVDHQRIDTVEPVARFSADYGFINKRLPVWRVAFKDSDLPRIFVDAADGVIAARSTAADRFESRVFSFVHKWGFLNWMGQKPRDLVIMFFVSLIVLTAIFGWILQMRRLKTRRR